MRRRTSATLAVALACALSAAGGADGQSLDGAPATVTPPSDPRARFAGGSFLFVGGEPERSGVRRAIDRATDGMFFLVRPIADGRLRDSNPVYATVAFRFDPQSVEVSYAGRAFRTPANGAAVATRGIVGPVRVNSRVDPGRVVQVFVADDGTSRNEFELSPDGRTLTMHVTVTSPRLPRPLQYALTYRR